MQTFRDLRERPLSPDEFASILDRVGGTQELFTRLALKCRQLGLHQRHLSPRERAQWMLKEPTFMTRPVVLATDSPSAMCGGWSAALRRFVEGLTPT